MSASVSVAQLLGFGDARVSVVRAGPDDIVTLSMPELVPGEFRESIGAVIDAIAERLGVDRAAVFVLDGGCTLETLGPDELARMGLHRI